ncbi:MAG: hypothetical protein FJ398_13140 [Verrucomicrobia bacterium]|nr:hypothetical protein [Verrucomicrobiota bacterium]
MRHPTNCDDRVKAMSENLFQFLLETGDPLQKTVIFCTRDHHANQIMIALNNLYAAWCQKVRRTPKEWYAFQGTGNPDLRPPAGDLLPEFRGSRNSHFIATPANNIVYFGAVDETVIVASASALAGAVLACVRVLVFTFRLSDHGLEFIRKLQLIFQHVVQPIPNLPEFFSRQLGQLSFDLFDSRQTPGSLFGSPVHTNESSPRENAMTRREPRTTQNTRNVVPRLRDLRLLLSISQKETKPTKGRERPPHVVPASAA